METHKCDKSPGTVNAKPDQNGNWHIWLGDDRLVLQNVNYCPFCAKTEQFVQNKFCGD